MWPQTRVVSQNQCLISWNKTTKRLWLKFIHKSITSDWRSVRSLIHSSYIAVTRWRHQMETFSALLAICAGNSPVNGEFPAQRPVMWIFDVFFDLCLNKWLSKQSWGWWFETLSRPLWRHCNDFFMSNMSLPSVTPCDTEIRSDSNVDLGNFIEQLYCHIYQIDIYNQLRW